MQTLMKPFNTDPAIEDLVKILEKDFSFDLFVETGTYHGATTKWFAETFPEKETHTVDNNLSLFRNLVETLGDKTNVYCHFGESPTLLKDILEGNLNKKIFFYLDAHWYDQWPLLDELDVISRYCKDNCCIMIDDFRVPYRPFQFDRYKGQKLDLEYVHSSLRKIFSEPFFFFNDKSQRKPVAVGKLICIPSSWKSHLSLEITKDREYFYY